MSKIVLPEDVKALQEQDKYISKNGKFTAICDFADGSASTAFFTANDDPNWYVWFEITPAMHSSVLSAVNNTALNAWVMVNENDQTKLNRLIISEKPI